MRDAILIPFILFFALFLSWPVRAESPSLFSWEELPQPCQMGRTKPEKQDRSIYRGQMSGGSLNLVQSVDGTVSYAVPVTSLSSSTVNYYSSSAWSWQALPIGTIYRNYLAGPNESRVSALWNHDKDKGWLADVTLGGRLPLLRYGPGNSVQAAGFQVEIEGATQLRVDMDKNLGIDATNFKFGVPLSFGNEMLQFKTGYYHVSSNMTDRTVVINGVPITRKELDYSRNSWMLGISCQFPQALRIYAEADYGFSGERIQPWHLQFGAEYCPTNKSRSMRGNLFVAINALLMEECDFDGNINVQVGWQWQGQANRSFRIGMQYLGGYSEQFKYLQNEREHKVGIGLWYDF